MNRVVHGTIIVVHFGAWESAVTYNVLYYFIRYDAWKIQVRNESHKIFTPYEDDSKHGPNVQADHAGTAHLQRYTSGIQVS